MRAACTQAARAADALHQAAGGLEGDWEGRAQQSFRAGLQADLAVLAENLESLDALRKAAHQAMEEYKSCEADVRRLIASLST